MDLLTATISEISSSIKTKKISAKEVTQFFLNRKEQMDPQLNSYISVNSEALKTAESIDQKIQQGDNLGELAGIPIAVKDMFCTKGLKTTAGSKILSNFIPPYDATVISKLKSAGAIVLGKLNQDEFAMGSSNENSFFGVTRNPWDLTRVPGGSSGGSAAAQAARLCVGALGTDTGGSIRQPASFCGVVGVKPTYGRISRYGIIAYASSLDQAGPMANSVEDAAVMLEVMCGHDPKDGTTSNQVVPAFHKNLNANMKGLKVGILKEYITDGLTGDIQATFQSGIKALQEAGADIVDISVPLTESAVAVYYLVAASEASSNLARYDGVKFGYRSSFKNISELSLDDFYSITRGEGFGAEVKRRIMLGTYCLSSGYYDAYYNKACQVRRMMRDQFQQQFKKCDIILSPVTTAPAFKIGEKISDPLEMYLNDIFTVSTNLAGLPGMSVPFGFSKSTNAEAQLPIGLQIMANHFDEQKMLNVAYFLQQVSGLKGQVAHVVS